MVTPRRDGRRSRIGRRFLTGLAAFGLVATSLMTVGGALAVNNTGAFELDGNAVTSHTGTAAPDDADRVCYQVAKAGGATDTEAATKCFGTGDTATPGGTVNATATTWVDSSVNPEIFTGGGSKDPQDPGNDWLWKPKDTIPDKDTILHGFAARYSLAPDASTCPVKNPATDLTCEVIFFGVDRFDNSGDAQLGFWFFKDTVATTNTASQGGFKFTGHHNNGDLLVISDFSNGGTTSTILVYFWDTSCGSNNLAANKVVNNPTAGQCGANNLRLQATSSNANCATSAATSSFCGIVNTGNGAVAPWSFTDKSGNHTYLAGEYYEAGINLSNLGIGNECFASIEGESRSSTSPTATLKDFFLGNFQNCSASAVTTPSSSSVSPGTPIHDTMTITGSGSGTPPFPSSDETTPSPAGHNVSFGYCGPIATGICDSSTVARTPTAIPPTKELTPTATQGVSTAVSADINTSGSPLLPGRYCFAGSWAGDINYPKGASDNSATECFTVVQIPTTTVTTPASAADGSAVVGTVTLGSTIYDKAVVTGTTAGGNPPGTVSFFVCNPSQITGSAGSENCAAGAGTAVTGNPKTLVADAGSSPPTSTVVSGGVTMSTSGVWCFRATYTPSGSVYLTSSDNGSHTECVTVGTIGTTTVTTPKDATTGATITSVSLNTSVKDYALVTANAAGDGTPTGTVDFFICNPAAVTGTGATAHCADGTGTQVGSSVTVGAVAGSNPPASEALSAAVTANAIGVWCFRATYTPSGANGSNYTGSSDSSNGECFSVSTTSSATSAQDWLPNDSVTLTTVGAVALDGTLDISLRADTCTGSTLYQEDTSNDPGIQPIALSNTASGSSFSTTNTSVKVSTASNKTYYWRAVFTSTNPFVASYTKCELTTMTINNNP